DRLLAERTTEWEESVRWSSTMMIGGAGVLLVMLCLIAYFASRDYRAVGAESWIRRVQAGVAGELQGDHRVEGIGEKVLVALSRYLDPQVGAVLVTEPGDRLRRVAGHALASGAATELGLGESLAGQAMKSRRAVQLSDVPADFHQITSATGRTRAHTVAISP